MKLESIGKFALIFLAGMFANAPAASASQVTPMGLESVVDKSAQIFVGEILSVEAQEGDNGLPYVVYQIDISQAIFGVDTGVTEFRFLGNLGHIGSLPPVAGLPTYEPGDEVLLFLRAASDRGLTSPTGMDLGSLPLLTDSIEPRLQPHPLLAQESLSLTSHERQLLSRGSLSVESFIGMVETILDRKNLR